MTENFNDKFYDTTANAAESLENRVRRLKIRKLIKRNAAIVGTIAAVIYIVKKATEDI